MPRHGLVIAGLVLLCVGIAAADQLLQGVVRRPARPEALGLSSLPVSGLGAAMVRGAQHRLDRQAAMAE